PTAHTYNSHCRLRPLSPSNDEIPPITPQFFYSSPIPIDDPLSAAIATIPDASNPASTSTVQNHRPFSEGDNLSLERAWLQFSTPHSREQHKRQVRRYWYRTNNSNNKVDDDEGEIKKRLEGVVERLARGHVERHTREGGIVGKEGLVVATLATLGGTLGGGRE
ncbi:hypothetical protein B0T21DRAFT_256660, partial [Apiosordaria backusii]